MCGVFGFVSVNGSVNLKTLFSVALANESRGMDAWGFSWIDSKNQLHSWKTIGAISDNVHMMKMASDAKLLIGHTRWATTGTPADEKNNHPHKTRGGFIVHNGTIVNWVGLAKLHNLRLKTDCDSEILARLLEKFSYQPLLQRCVTVANLVESRPLVMLGLFKSGELAAIRNGNPLWTGTNHEGVYLSSLRWHLPGPITEVPDRQCSVYTKA